MSEQTTKAVADRLSEAATTADYARLFRATVEAIAAAKRIDADAGAVAEETAIAVWEASAREGGLN